MSKVKIYLESSQFAKIEVFPSNYEQFEWKEDSEVIFYRHEASNSFKFTGSDFHLIKQMESFECEDILITVEKLCSGIYIEYWKGFFKYINCTSIDEDRCSLEVKPEPNDEYKCYNSNKDLEVNIQLGVLVTADNVPGTYETVTCSDENIEWNQLEDGNLGVPRPSNSATPPLTDCLFGSNAWCLVSNELTLVNEYIDPTNGDTVIYNQVSVWHRETLETTCSSGSPVPPVEPGWQLLENNCGSSNTSKYWRCPANAQLAGPYEGFTLETILNNLFFQMGCNHLTVKSDFFNINPIGNSPSNDAYQYATDFLHNLTVHQKSDVKRKNASNSSSPSSWVMKPEECIDDLRKIFNVWYVIEGNTFIIEHYSFFSSFLGLDFTSNPMKKVYDFSGLESTKIENFEWMDNYTSLFSAAPVYHDCGEDIKDTRVINFSTDLLNIENPNLEDKFDDAGFVLVANNFDVTSQKYSIINNNEPLKWDNLLTNLHKYGRPYRSGSIAGVAQNFESWKPYKKQEPFKVPLCCSDVFNPFDLIQTSLGFGKISSAKHNIVTNSLELELLY